VAWPIVCDPSASLARFSPRGASSALSLLLAPVPERVRLLLLRVPVVLVSVLVLLVLVVVLRLVLLRQRVEVARHVAVATVAQASVLALSEGWLPTRLLFAKTS
jgi:hypothetical protein